MSKRARVDREKRSAIDSPAEQQDECVFYDKVIVSQEEMDAELEQKKIPEKPKQEELMKLFGNLNLNGQNLVFLKKLCYENFLDI